MLPIEEDNSDIKTKKAIIDSFLAQEPVEDQISDINTKYSTHTGEICLKLIEIRNLRVSSSSNIKKSIKNEKLPSTVVSITTDYNEVVGNTKKILQNLDPLYNETFYCNIFSSKMIFLTVVSDKHSVIAHGSFYIDEILNSEEKIFKLELIPAGIAHITLSLSNIDTNDDKTERSEKDIKNIKSHINFRFGHRFISAYLKKPTYCSTCKEFIWGVIQKQGLKCQICECVIHVRCIDKVNTQCTCSEIEHSIRDLNILNKHKLEEFSFHIIKCCSHCGTMICGLKEKGFKCSSCQNYYHAICKDNIAADCGTDLDKRKRSKTISNINASISVKNKKVLKSRNSLQLYYQEEHLPQYTLIKIYPYYRLINQETDNFSIENFNLISVIYHKDNKQIFLAHNIKKKKYYALKVLKIDEYDSRFGLEIYFSEINILMSLQHEFIPKFIACFHYESCFYMTMEFCCGGDFRYFLSKVNELSKEDTQFYIAQLISALQYIHDNQIIHRNVKLENILIDQDGYLKLTGFGIAIKGISKDNLASTFCGSPEYMAPELALTEKNSNQYGFTVDWWSLGICSYEMLCGNNPYQNVKICENETVYDKIVNINPTYPKNISAEAVQLIQGLLQKDPISRYGIKVEGSISDLMDLEYFNGLAWDDFLNMKIKTPCVPYSDYKKNLKNFDKNYTSLPICITKNKKKSKVSIKQSLNNESGLILDNIDEI